jgi:hypothetical protein
MTYNQKVARYDLEAYNRLNEQLTSADFSCCNKTAVNGTGISAVVEVCVPSA